MVPLTLLTPTLPPKTGPGDPSPPPPIPSRLVRAFLLLSPPSSEQPSSRHHSASPLRSIAALDRTTGAAPWGTAVPHSDHAVFCTRSSTPIDLGRSQLSWVPRPYIESSIEARLVEESLLAVEARRPRAPYRGLPLALSPANSVSSQHSSPAGRKSTQRRRPPNTEHRCSHHDRVATALCC